MKLFDKYINERRDEFSFDDSLKFYVALQRIGVEAGSVKELELTILRRIHELNPSQLSKFRYHVFH